MARLRRSNLHAPGITRRRRGRGFRYEWQATGEPVDGATRERIEALVIPPAWQHVWISPWPHGHIQAVGTDGAGRRQYLYHEDWRRRRDTEKYARALEFGAALPAVRRAVAADLASDGLTERRVLAAAIRLLDVGAFRIGGEAYARDHETYGVATILRRHVRVAGGEMHFTYPAKGSIARALVVRDPEVEAVIGPLRRRRSQSERLLAYRSGRRWVDLHSADVNSYLKETAGPQFSAKDFRTWSGTVFAAVALALVEPPPGSATARRRAVVAAVKDAAEHLGNTPSVCRASYVHPRVLDLFEQGTTLSAHGWVAEPGVEAAAALVAAEAAVLAMLGDDLASAAQTAAGARVPAVRRGRSAEAA